MAAVRTNEQILDEVVFAIEQVARYYGPGFSEEGLQHIRSLFHRENFHCDSTWRVDAEDTRYSADQRDGDSLQVKW